MDIGFFLLFGTLAIGAMLVSSCKKDAILTGTEESANLSVANRESQLTRSNDPRILFVDKNVLWSITNIAVDNPTITQQGEITGITPACGDMKCNVFNESSVRQVPIYNPYTDHILAGGNQYLYKCFVPTRINTTMLVPGYNPNFTTVTHPIGINPKDGKIYYYKHAFDNGPEQEIFGSMNPDGTNNVIHRYFNNTQVTPNTDRNTCAIDFEKNIMYMSSKTGIYVTSINSPGESTLFMPAIFGETMDYSEVKVDKLHNTIFFSTTIHSKKLRRVYRCDPQGNNIKKIIEVSYTYSLNIDGLDKNTFSFDISPETSQVFFCQRRTDPVVKFVSTVSRINMDGTGYKLLHTGIYINTIIAAKPIIPQ